MDKVFIKKESMQRWATIGLITLALAIFVGQPVMAESLEGLLEQVGEDYAVSYSSPFLYAFGPNQNAGTYTTAHIPWSGLTFGFGVKVMATHLNADDQAFSKNINNVDLGEFDPDYAGETGNVVMSGPTLFGDTETNGTVTGYLHGLPVFQQETIPGLIDTRFVPLAAPEAYIGGIFGLKATVRYFPEIDMSDYGKSKYFGYGLQWSPNGLLPTLPFDVMIGFFDQQLKVGTLLETNATTYFLGASKDFSPLRIYGGFAKDKSDMSVGYKNIYDDMDISFAVDGIQKSHFTLGVGLHFLLDLNLEMNVGDLVTYSGGLMLGF
jgi:Family of unknown function (DUF6588)